MRFKATIEPLNPTDESQQLESMIIIFKANTEHEAYAMTNGFIKATKMYAEISEMVILGI